MKKMFLCFTLLLYTMSNMNHRAADSYSEINDIAANVQASHEIEAFLNELGIDLDAFYDENINLTAAEDSYGGAWIDENNVAHVAFTRIIPEVNLLTKTEFAKVMIEKADFSFAELLQLQNLIFQLEIDAVYSIAIDESGNCLLVGIANDESIAEIFDAIQTVNTENVKIKFEISKGYKRY